MSTTSTPSLFRRTKRDMALLVVVYDQEGVRVLDVTASSAELLGMTQHYTAQGYSVVVTPINERVGKVFPFPFPKPKPPQPDPIQPPIDKADLARLSRAAKALSQEVAQLSERLTEAANKHRPGGPGRGLVR